jgi:hypothetical protein
MKPGYLSNMIRTTLKMGSLVLLLSACDAQEIAPAATSDTSSVAAPASDGAQTAASEAVPAGAAEVSVDDARARGHREGMEMEREAHERGMSMGRDAHEQGMQMARDAGPDAQRAKHDPMPPKDAMPVQDDMPMMPMGDDGMPMKDSNMPKADSKPDPDPAMKDMGHM